VSGPVGVRCAGIRLICMFVTSRCGCSAALLAGVSPGRRLSDGSGGQAAATAGLARLALLGVLLLL